MGSAASAINIGDEFLFITNPRGLRNLVLFKRTKPRSDTPRLGAEIYSFLLFFLFLFPFFLENFGESFPIFIIAALAAEPLR